MSKVYINGISSISPQLESVFQTNSPIEYNENILRAVDQDYKSLIKPMMLRRMSKAVKMALFCSKKALQEAQVEMPDAILVGTGQGCMQDTEKFMTDILDSGEGLVSPTSFIQSTHNTVGGQIALDFKCKGHNMTFTQNSVSFECALIDSLLQIDTDDSVKNVLVGGVDETSESFTGFQKLDGQVKSEDTNNLDLFNSRSKGTIISESAAFFALSITESDNCYAELKDVETFNSIEVSDLESRISAFLKRNDLDIADIDAVVLGKNGDSRFDHFYEALQAGTFLEIAQIGYKHLVGENNSVSSYAFWLASRILKEKYIPEIFKLNTVNCSNPRNILIYNQYLGKNHGLILLQSL